MPPKKKPAECYGAGPECHKAGCRPGRPACRWRRRARGVCRCDAYPYPHSDGHGRCNPAVMDLIANGPIPHDERVNHD